MSQEIIYSYFSNCLDTQPAQQLTTWTQFVHDLDSERSLRRADDRTKKHATPLISPAAYELGDSRKDANVIGWGGWMALDIDNDGLFPAPFDMAAAEIRALNVNALIYSTTKATATHHRYRVLLHLNRDLTPEEIRPHHAAVCRMFGNLGPDLACKDLSRIYAVPTTWIPSGEGNAEPVNLFWSRTDGSPLDVDAVLAAHPSEPIASHMPPLAPRGVQSLGSRTIYSKNGMTYRPLPSGCSILTSPVVTASMIEDYINGPRGSHHVGLYRFMTRVAARARLMEFEITAEDLVGYAREVNAISPIKTATTRWARSIYTEAASALDYAGLR
jgi:hypothetical protein